MNKLLLTSILIISSACTYGQLAGSDIYLGTIEWKKDFPKISPVENVSVKRGYDNQPSFSSDNLTVYYVTTQGGKTDIYRYFIDHESRAPLTATKEEDEYSPFETPDNQVSFVRVEKDSAQRIWKIDSQKKTSLVSPKLDSVGYYQWIDKDNIIAFRITKKQSLAIFNIPSQTWTDLDKKPGRCFQKVGNQVYLAFSEKNDTIPSIYKMTGKDKFEKVATSLTQEADFAVSPDGHIFQAKGRLLYYFHPVQLKWIEIGQSIMKQVSDITRIAISPNGQYLVLVCAEGKE